MSKRADEVFKGIAQVLAIVCLVGIFAVIAHKGYNDMAELARNGSGQGFGVDVLRYIFRNLAG
jgi:hypothetical protein